MYNDRLYFCALMVMFFGQMKADDSKIVALSIPKSGSFLLYKCINLLTGKQPMHAYHASYFEQWDKGFVTNHELPTQETLSFFERHNIRGVFIYRDPRDQIVSSAFFFKDYLKNPKAVAMEMHNLITDFMYDSCLWWDYVVFMGHDRPENKNINSFYRAQLGWLKSPQVYCTSFEKLVGPRGGGFLELQLREIRNIANHLGIRVTDEQIRYIADQLFGRFTFREGKIGAWRDHFSNDHRALFKALTGNLVIELGYEKDLAW